LSQLANLHATSVDTMITQIQKLAVDAQNYIYDGPSSTIPLDKSKFGDSASAGATTVSQWFDQNDGAIALSQQNGSAIFLHTSDWHGKWSSLDSPFSKWNGTPTPYGLGVLLHELLHKQMVAGGFNHDQMRNALNKVGAPGAVYGREDISDRIRKICFQ
jgi:hypothetical protein